MLNTLLFVKVVSLGDENDQQETNSIPSSLNLLSGLSSGADFWKIHL